MNILLTNSCNRKCPYCFAQERISYTNQENIFDPKPQIMPGRITREDFRATLHFAKDNGQNIVGILGGEPSVHPQFIELLKDAWAEGLITKIFTNGLWKKKVIEQFMACTEKEKEKAHIIVNINEPDITSDKERLGQERLLSSIGKHCGLSFNIYHEGFSPLFLTDVIDLFKCRRHIRLGIAVPLANLNSQYVEIDHYSKVAQTIMALAQRCDERDITLGFDCGFILCMFTAEEIGKLWLYGAKFKSSCGSPIDIGTDLSVWPCFPLSTFAKGFRLQDFENMESLVTSFNNQFGRLYNAGALDKCVDCKYRRRKQCSAGCAALVYRRLH